MNKPTLEETFTRIFRSGWWGSEESVSGRGSELATTVAIRENLGAWLARNPRVQTLFDAPCGDFNWMRLVDFPAGVRYIGGDIVADLIDKNNETYGNDLRRFVHLDATSDAFPQADAWFCRDMMIHLPLPLCLSAIANCRRAGMTYILATTFINADNQRDIAPGHYRQVNLAKAPFDLGPPIEMLPDPAENNQTDRFIGVWRLD
ncbi:class I SAM-dependent methyltransferase [Roseomonas sp. CECT 9278]|uniref:class I SAM-dependent methyltransferase n=1 Tax=Roseomonas sp. CECT 9278 TaxID=2845823 RepID=UPI001E2F2344|nr:class I SAM-dependent methyltransferase [Roseomonas sp. CECT 9278]CAH0138140.1 hypothetical protein ROS9278_00408 [Roseomonas sp. CECT 9278]